jgi:phosphatidylglycerophosphatase A
MIFEKAIATAFGIGYINRGAGTVASIAYCIVWYWQPEHSLVWQCLSVALVLIVGYWSAGVVEKWWGKDNNKVVIDEVTGMMVALLSIPVSINNAIVAFILFRFFDIVKPLGIRRLEKLPSGLGVMADDFVAGLYSLIILKVFIAIDLT